MAATKTYPENLEPTYSTLEEIDMSAAYSYANYLRFAFDERFEIIKEKFLR